MGGRDVQEEIVEDSSMCPLSPRPSRIEYSLIPFIHSIHWLIFTVPPDGCRPTEWKGKKKKMSGPTFS
jgi:hypothetical protein